MDATMLPEPRRLRPAHGRFLLFLGLLCGLALACGSLGGSANPAGLPAISGFSPASGMVNSQVTLTGSNFNDVKTITFSGVAAITYIAASVPQPPPAPAGAATSYTLTVTVPPGATSGPIVVTTASGSAVSPGAFTVLPNLPPAPVVGEFGPTSGPAATTRVAITGSGFTQNLAVTFNGVPVPATGINRLSDTRIEVMVPANASTGVIGVETDAGRGVSSQVFTVTLPPAPDSAAPTVSGFTPAAGPGGTEVTVDGADFVNVRQVSFGGVAATDITGTEATQLTVRVPAGAVSGPITVSTLGGTATSTLAFIVAPPPALDSFSPADGPAGTRVTLRGTGLANASQVTFGGVSVTMPFTDASDTGLTVSVPAGAASGPIRVAVPGAELTSGTGFTVTGLPGPAPAPPVIVGFSPAGGGPLTFVDIQGTGLASPLQVYFNGASAAAVYPQSDTHLRVQVPSNASTGLIVVRTAEGDGPSQTSISFQPPPAPPALAGFTPPTGGAGVAVTLQGTGLDTLTAVYFGNELGIIDSRSATSAVVRVPNNAATGRIRVVGPGGNDTGQTDFIIPAAPVIPTVSRFDPQQGVALSPVTIYGTDLDQADQVTFSGVPAAFHIDSPIQLTATVPVAASGALQVRAGTTLLPVGFFQVIPAPPVITGFTPRRGGPGTRVTLEGTGLANATAVTFNGVNLPLNRLTQLGDTRVWVRVPDTAPAVNVPGPIGLATAGGSNLTPGNFTLLAARNEIFQDAFDVVSPFLTGAQLQLPAGQGSAVYAATGILFPKAPVFNAYHPTSVAGEPIGLRPDPADPAQRLDGPTFTLNFRLPGQFYEALPDAVKTRVADLGIDINQVDFEILVVSQNYAYDGVTHHTGEYLFRPSLWVVPDAASLAPYPGYNVGGTARASLVLQDPLRQDPADPLGDRRIAIDGLGGPDATGAVPFQVHDDGAGNNIVSPDTPLMLNLLDPGNLAAPFTSTALYSLVSVDNRLAITLHLMMSDDDQGRLAAIAAGSADLEHLVPALRAARASFTPGGQRGIDMLSRLTGPLVTQARMFPVPGAFGQSAIEVLGSGFDGATSVTLAPSPGGAITYLVESDGEIRVLANLVPAGTQLTITTPMGTTTVPLPFPAP